jgi:hypothetical protein
MWAPALPDLTICEFCGAATVELKGLADELKAIDDMVALEQKVRREVDLSDKGQVGSHLYRTAQSEAGIEVMTGSFIRKYPEALIRSRQNFPIAPEASGWPNWTDSSESMSTTPPVTPKSYRAHHLPDHGAHRFREINVAIAVISVLFLVKFIVV